MVMRRHIYTFLEASVRVTLVLESMLNGLDNFNPSQNEKKILCVCEECQFVIYITVTQCPVTFEGAGKLYI